MIRVAALISADVLLIEDREAVIQARAQGFRVAPTIAIYIEAKRRGMITTVKEKMDYLRAARFRLTDRDYQTVLAACGEM